MTREEFLRRLGEVIEDLAEEIQDSPDRAFVAYVLQSVGGIERDTAIEDAEVGNGDLDVDGFDKDDDARVVTIVQGKYRPDGTYSVAREEVETFFGLPDRLLNAPLAARAEVHAAQLDYRACVAQGYDVRLIFAVAGTFSPQAEDEIRRRRGALPPNHTADFVNLDTLHAYFEHSAQQPVTFSIVGNQIFTRDLPQSAIFTTPASDLAAIYDRLGNAIFQLNPRLTLKRSKVNAKIVATLREPDDKAFFWAYNNGISVVCDDFRRRDSNQILVFNMRIVNGCQTTTAIATAHRDGLLTDNVHVLVRLFVAPPRAGELAERISERTNRQNAIRSRDLVSNDEEQRRLEQEFQNLGYFYERKAGGADALPRADKRRYREKLISSEMAGRAYLAFTGRPKDAISLSEEELFDDAAATYQQVYGRQAVELVISWHFWEALNTFRRYLRAEFARTNDPALARLRRLVDLKVGRHFVLALIGRLVAQRYRDRPLEAVWQRISTGMTRDQRREFVEAAAKGVRGSLADMLPKEDVEYDEIDLRKYLIQQAEPSAIIAKRERMIEAGGGRDHVLQLLPAP